LRSVLMIELRIICLYSKDNCNRVQIRSLNLLNAKTKAVFKESEY
jgi:hypothetical protein